MWVDQSLWWKCAGHARGRYFLTHVILHFILAAFYLWPDAPNIQHEMFSQIYALVTFTHAKIVVDENGWWINEFTSIYKLAEFHGTTHTGGHHPPPSDRWEYSGVSELGGVSDDDEWSCLWFERGIGHINIDSHTQYAYIINRLPHIHAYVQIFTLTYADT